MDGLPGILEHLSDRVLGQPIDLEVGLDLLQLLSDGQVAAGVTEPDRRREVERLLPAVHAPGPYVTCHGHLLDLVDELANGAVDLDRLPCRREMTGALDDEEIAPGELGKGPAPLDVLAHVAVAVDGEGGSRQ